ncbi:hypothetical protein NMY22_g17698 [Coprinellus aureogranulatus]|nr:hypothetical protein NMY22_g17698 [Coprinellus aureogranulatus]
MNPFQNDWTLRSSYASQTTTRWLLDHCPSPQRTRTCVLSSEDPLGAAFLPTDIYSTDLLRLIALYLAGWSASSTRPRHQRSASCMSGRRDLESQSDPRFLDAFTSVPASLKRRHVKTSSVTKALEKSRTLNAYCAGSNLLDPRPHAYPSDPKRKHLPVKLCEYRPILSSPPTPSILAGLEISSSSCHCPSPPVPSFRSQYHLTQYSLAMMATLRFSEFSLSAHTTGSQAALGLQSVAGQPCPPQAYPPGPLIHEYPSFIHQADHGHPHQNCDSGPVGDTNTRQPKHPKAKARLPSTWKSIVDLAGEFKVVSCRRRRRPKRLEERSWKTGRMMVAGITRSALVFRIAGGFAVGCSHEQASSYHTFCSLLPLSVPFYGTMGVRYRCLLSYRSKLGAFPLTTLIIFCWNWSQLGVSNR